ncbi:MAG: TetR/AcrR family transcriptional regulator [Mycobacteriaceae bacterium]
MTSSAVSTRASGSRRDSLAAAAAELFATRGYEAVSVEDVAAAAGLSAPGVYRHFADKQALLVEVVRGGIGKLEGCAVEEGTGLSTLVEHLAALAVQRPPAAVVWRWTGLHLAPEQQREVGRRTHALLAQWGARLRSARPDLVEDDAELLCWAVLSVLGSTCVHRVRIGAARTQGLLAQACTRVLAVRPGCGVAVGSSAPSPSAGGGRRAQIVDAASELFAHRGYLAVGVDDIGAAVGIAGPSVYRHFPNKMAVLVAVCQRAADRLAAGVAQAEVDGVLTPARLVRVYVDALLTSTDLRVGMSTDRSLVTGAERTRLHRQQREHVAHWVRALRRVHPELDDAAAAVTVHAALTVANDLARTRSVRHRPGLGSDLQAVLLAVLDAPVAG